MKFPRDFDPDHGTVSKAIATCLVCRSVVDGDTTRKIFQQGRAGEKLVAIILHGGKSGKTYRIANEDDVKRVRRAEEYLQEKRRLLLSEWGLDPVPDEPTPEGKGRGAERVFAQELQTILAD